MMRHMSDATITRRLRIRGRVQGVGFRMHFAEQARTHGLGGWVRNRRDGSVEATISGSAAGVAKVIEWARHGPPSARVTDLQVTDAEGAFSSFDVKPTE